MAHGTVQSKERKSYSHVQGRIVFSRLKGSHQSLEMLLRWGSRLRRSVDTYSCSKDIERHRSWQVTVFLASKTGNAGLLGQGISIALHQQPHQPFQKQ